MTAFWGFFAGKQNYPEAGMVSMMHITAYRDRNHPQVRDEDHRRRQHASLRK
jgi:hypothetical protein